MSLLILGVLIWWGAHLLKRLAPGVRSAMDAQLGVGRAKGAIAALLALSVLLMIFGYRMSEQVNVWTPPGWGIHLNNLLMIIAIALMGAGNSKGRARALLRHPMLMGAAVWAFAHLLVNGDLASLILFGGIGAWAVFHQVIINAREPEWTRPEPGPASGDVKLLVITVVLYAVIAAVHTWLGYWPFAG